MSYVRANTAPPFGMRSQSLDPMSSRLGYYFNSGFPLPTTGMSAPLRLGSAFWDGPDNVYPQPEQSRTRATETGALSGEWVPPQPPGRALFQQGAVTYRIDPRTGRYEFHSTDLLPRGLFQQNTFQHPMRPALSSLGVPVGSRGTTLVRVNGRNVVMHTTPRRGPTSQTPLMKLKAALGAMFSGGLSCHGGCGCGGSCGKHLGDDEPCGIDSDGNVMLCPVNTSTPGGGGGSGSTVINDSPWSGGGSPSIQNVQNGGIMPGTGGGGGLQQASTVLQQIANGLNPHPATPVQTITPSSWLKGSTAIAGMSIPNMVLAGGLVLVGLTLGGKHK